MPETKPDWADEIAREVAITCHALSGVPGDYIDKIACVACIAAALRVEHARVQVVVTRKVAGTDAWKKDAEHPASFTEVAKGDGDG